MTTRFINMLILNNLNRLSREDPLQRGKLGKRTSKLVYSLGCMQKSSCTPNIVKNSLEMLIYFHGNCAFSLPNFMTYRASLWNTIRLLHLLPWIDWPRNPVYSFPAITLRCLYYHRDPFDHSAGWLGSSEASPQHPCSTTRIAYHDRLSPSPKL